MTLDRILTFERELQRRCADRIVALPFGWAVLRPDLPLVYDLNAVIVNRPVDDVDAVLDATGKVLHQAGLPHRRLIIDPPADPQPIVEAATARGWRAERMVAMALSRPLDRPRKTNGVAELGLDAYRPLQRRFHGEEPWASPAVLDQMDVANRRLAEVATLRCFAAGEEAGCLLIGVGDVAQIDSVHTLESSRGRGLGRAVIQRAIEEALAAGYDLVHLFADAEDWPLALYTKMGFDAVGDIVTCHR